MVKYQKVGGLHFLRVGRIGGSIYLARPRALTKAEAFERDCRVSGALEAAAVVLGAFMLASIPAALLILGA